MYSPLSSKIKQAYMCMYRNLDFDKVIKSLLALKGKVHFAYSLCSPVQTATADCSNCIQHCKWPVEKDAGVCNNTEHCSTLVHYTSASVEELICLKHQNR